MSLTNRVCTFFLSALAIILVIYSLVFYTVTCEHLYSKFDGELERALSSLVAAAEVEETEVKWQPLEHAINFGSHDELGEIEWIVIGDEGFQVEHSRPIDREFLSQIRDRPETGRNVDGADVMSREAVDGWVVLRQDVAAPRPDRAERELDEFDRLSIVVGRPTVVRDATLQRLILLVTILPLLAWSIAALAGRWIVRIALRPVTNMAEQAKAITGNDFQTRLVHGDAKDELTKLGDAFNHLLDRQQVAFEQQRRFAGDAAHELRTPITILLGQIDVTLRRPRDRTAYEETLQLLRAKTLTLQEIVEALLFLARSDADADRLSLRPLELAAWLATQAESWRHDLGREVIQLDIELADETFVRATPTLLGRVVDNLVFNAVKYGDESTQVTIRASTMKDFAEIQVHDNGPGIASEDVQQLFTPFFRSRDARRRGIAGTGLGLAIAHRIASLLEGELTCASWLGEGTCFTLRLPIVKSAVNSPMQECRVDSEA